MDGENDVKGWQPFLIKGDLMVGIEGYKGIRYRRGLIPGSVVYYFFLIKGV